MAKKITEITTLQQGGFIENEQKKVVKAGGRIYRVFEKKNFGFFERLGGLGFLIITIIFIGLPALSQAVKDQINIFFKNKITRNIEQKNLQEPIPKATPTLLKPNIDSSIKKLLWSSEQEGPYFGKSSMVESFKGAFLLLQSKVTDGCDRRIGNFLLNLLTADHSEVICLGTRSKEHSPSSLKDKSVILPIIELNKPSQEAEIIATILKELKEIYRIDTEMPKKIILPLALFNPTGHAVTVIIEPNPNDPESPNVSIINPFGESSYRKQTDKAAQGIFEAFPKAVYIFNKVKQQTDVRTCGFHQITNILALIPQNNVLEFVMRDKLPKRTTKDIQAWVDTLKPKIGVAYQEMSNWFDVNWGAEAINFKDESGTLLVQETFVSRYPHHFY